MMTSITPAPRGTLVVGRILKALEYKNELLPVSCTVGLLKNSLLSKHGLSDLMRFASQGLRFGAGVALHVSEFSKYDPYEFQHRVHVSQDHPDSHLFTLKEWTPPQKDEYVIKVLDSMQDKVEGVDGLPIEESWVEFIKACTENKKVVVDLTDLRPAGADNGSGLVASGPHSFSIIYDVVAEFLESPSLTSLCQIFSCLNGVLRRGGLFKNGAITIHFDYDQEGAYDFVRMPRAKTNWARLCLNIDKNFLDLPSSKINGFLRYVSTGDVFIVKKVYDKNGERIRHNVCLEILLRPFGTCLLSHLNTGLLSNSSLIQGGRDGMTWLCELHANTGVQNSEFYLSPEEDKQVGFGLVGLSNALAIRGILYAEFAEASEVLISEKLPDVNPKVWNPDFNYYEYVGRMNNDAYEYANLLLEMYKESAKVARSYGMERAFTIAPTASCSFRGKDSEGYVTSPEIAPPIDLVVDRESETMDVIYGVEYNPNAEVAENVGYDIHYRVNCCIQTFMNSTGLAHSISFNWWSDKIVMNELEIGKFIKGPLLGLYYALPVSRLTQDKSRISPELGNCDTEQKVCTSCAE